MLQSSTDEYMIRRIISLTYICLQQIRSFQRSRKLGSVISMQIPSKKSRSKFCLLLKDLPIVELSIQTTHFWYILFIYL